MKIHVTEKKTVGQLAADYPALRRVMEEHGVDYCCGGKQDLATAARQAGLTGDQLEAILNEALERIEAQQQDTERNWTKASLQDLIDHIESRHHTYMKRELPRVEHLIHDVMRAHGAQHGAMLTELNQVFTGLRHEIEMHLAKEEQILFPYVREIESYHERGEAMPPMHCGTVQNPIRQMEHEHDNAGDALARMRELTNGYQCPPDACGKFQELYAALQEMEADLHEHIHLENNILFPKAVALEETSN